MVYRNLIRYHNTSDPRDLWVRYSFARTFSDPTSVERPWLSRPVFSEEHLENLSYEGPIQEELILAPLTFKLDLFYGVIDDIGRRVALGQDVRLAVRRQIAFDIYDLETPPHIPGGVGMLHLQLLRQLVETYNVGLDEIVTEGITVRNFLNLCDGVPPFDFALPPYPGT